MIAELDVIVSVMAVGGQIALGVVAASRLRRSPTAGPLLALAVTMALWTLAARANRMHLDRDVWHWIGTSTAPWLAAFAALYVYAFVAQRRDAALTSALLMASAVSLVAFLSRWVPEAAAFERSAAWDYALLGALVPSFALSCWRLWKARHRFVRRDETVRLQLVSAGWLVGFLGGLSETLADLHVRAPRVGPIGLLCATALMAFATISAETLRSRKGTIALLTGAFALVMSLAAQGLALLALSPREAVIVAVTASTVLVSLAILWPLASALRDRRAEAERLLFLGRVSDQLAHDVRNPLSAIIGATDFLRVEWRDAPASTHEMLDTVDVEARRIGATLDVYRRLSDMAPQRVPADLGAVAARALRNVRGDALLSVEADLPETLASIDPSLVLPALENLLRNAIEATAGNGRVRVSVAREAHLAWVRVADDGPGLDPEDEAWVTRSYFTTKLHGLGLGLALVKRVVDAHRGVMHFRRSDMGGLEVALAFEGIGQ